MLVCSDQRQSRFPFDVQHRNVITYKSESPSDFADLRKAIIARIKALLAKEKRIHALAALPVLEPTEGLSDHEIVALITVAKGGIVPGASVSTWLVKNDYERAGYTEIAVTLALRSLLRRNYLELTSDIDERGDQFPAYIATDAGLNWLEANQNRLVLRRKKPTVKDDDIPF